MKIRNFTILHKLFSFLTQQLIASCVSQGCVNFGSSGLTVYRPESKPYLCGFLKIACVFHITYTGSWGVSFVAIKELFDSCCRIYGFVAYNVR